DKGPPPVGKAVRGRAVRPVINESRRKRAVTVVILDQRQAELLEVVLALDAPSRFAGLLYGRQQETNQDADDGDDNQHLDECEPAPLDSHVVRHDRTSVVGRKPPDGNRPTDRAPLVIASGPRFSPSCRDYRNTIAC